jgi:predicted SprT family Zn-dependent metalloprotease
MAIRDILQKWKAEQDPAGIVARASSVLDSRIADVSVTNRTIRYDERLHDHPDLLREVLCHELAHIVAHDRFGPNIQPHGNEWADLVRQAGYEPRVRLSLPDAPLLSRPLPEHPVRYVHRCPVCQMSIESPAPQRHWRCATCRDAGLSGELTIHSVPRSASSR